MYERSWPVLILLICTLASAARWTPPLSQRLRGGADEADPHKEEIIERLNQCPTFYILDGESKLVALPNEEGGHDVCWFIDADEVQQVLELTIAANPDEGYHLGYP